MRLLSYQTGILPFILGPLLIIVSPLTPVTASPDLYPTFLFSATKVPTTFPLSHKLSSTPFPSTLSSNHSKSGSVASSFFNDGIASTTLPLSGRQPSGKWSSQSYSIGLSSTWSQLSGTSPNGAAFRPSGYTHSSIVPSGLLRPGVLQSGSLPSGVLPSGVLPSGIIAGGSGRPVLNSAQSASYLSFRKQEACTLSLSSFLAGGTTSSLNSYWNSLSSDGSYYLAHTPYTVFYKTTTNNKTISTTTLGPDDSCCGTCDVDYPQADILYWPVSTQNTWCLQFGATIPPPVTIGSVDGSILPAVLPAPTGLPVASGLDKREGPITTAPLGVKDRILYKRHAKARRSHLPVNESYAVGADGFTFVSPSIYVIFPVISATNECGQLGHVYTSLTESFAPGELSTVDGLSFTYGAFNAEDLPCPPSDGYETAIDINGQPASKNSVIMEFESVYAQQVKPFVQLPDRVTKLDPAWMSCGLSLINVGIDPPRALKPAEVLAPEITSVPPDPKATPAAPKPTPESPIPTPTGQSAPSPKPAGPGQNGEGSQTFDPNSVSPAQLSLKNQLLQPSQHPQIKPNPTPPNPSANVGGQKGSVADPAPFKAKSPDDSNSDPEDPHNLPIAVPTPASSPSQDTNSVPHVIIAQGQTLTENGASAVIGGKPAIYSAGSVYYASTTVAVSPSAKGQQHADPVIAGGITFAPAIYVNPDTNSGIVAGDFSFTPVHISNSYPPSARQPITAGGLIVTPMDTSPASAVAPVVIGGVTMTPIAAQAISTIVMGGRPIPITAAPGAGISTPQAYIIAGETVSRGGPSITLSGTPVALPSAGGVVIGLHTYASPVPANSVISLGGQRFTAVPGAFVVDGQSIFAGQPVSIAGSLASFGPEGLFYGSGSVAVFPPAPTSSVLTMGEQPFTIVPVAGGFSVNGHSVGEGQTINEDGTRIAYGSSGLTIGSSTIVPSLLPYDGDSVTGGYFVDGTALLPNQAVTISGRVISLNPSQIIMGTTTIPLPSPKASEAIIVINGQTLTALPDNSGYIDNGRTIRPGSPAITLKGTPISLATGASALIIGSSKILLATGVADGPLTAAGETFTPLSPGTIAIDGSTISIGGPPIIDHGTLISYASSGLVIGTSTFAFPTPAPNANDDKDGLVIGGQTLTMDGAAITVSGTSISLGETALTIGTSTIPLASVSAEGGMGAVISSEIEARPTGSVVPFAGGSTALAVSRRALFWSIAGTLWALALM